MAMNREQKRLLQRQGYVGKDGEFVPRSRPQPAAPARSERTPPRQFLREVRAELRKVVWPSRSETLNYSAVVLVFLVVFTALVAAVDWAFARGVLWLYGVN
ncbi:MAG: preprotein translocase subunit SecE [Acidimicrobiia bacterium]|nr:preprotein translocase subunit SecE [Acidimicrobiia bacterium]MDH5278395.1 preprotein translocase subunit SecE [Actinomycetota bacterium]